VITSADKLSKCFDRTIQRSNRPCKGTSYVLQRMYSFEVVELDWPRLKCSGLTFVGAVKVGWYFGYTPPR
jgi:hypothetical protein